MNSSTKKVLTSDKKRENKNTGRGQCHGRWRNCQLQSKGADVDSVLFEKIRIKPTSQFQNAIIIIENSSRSFNLWLCYFVCSPFVVISKFAACCFADWQVVRRKRRKENGNSTSNSTVSWTWRACLKREWSLPSCLNRRVSILKSKTKKITEPKTS